MKNIINMLDMWSKSMRISFWVRLVFFLIVIFVSAFLAFKFFLNFKDEQLRIVAIVAQIMATVILGSLALFQETIKRAWFSPELIIDFKQEPPDCHKTEIKSEKIDTDTDGVKSYRKIADAYYFRFEVTNVGNEHAKLCEVVLEKISKWNEEKKKFIKLEEWYPINLVWASSASKDEFRTINPGRSVFCDIGYVKSTLPQNFNLCLLLFPFSQPHQLNKGKYKIEIAVYSENSKKRNRAVKREFMLDWKGIWFDSQTEMFEKGITMK